MYGPIKRSIDELVNKYAGEPIANELELLKTQLAALDSVSSFLGNKFDNFADQIKPDLGELKEELSSVHAFRLEPPSQAGYKDGKVWSLIRNRALSNKFNVYEDFITHVFCKDSDVINQNQFLNNFTDGYSVLKEATEIFLKIGSLSSATKDNRVTKSSLAELKAHPEDNKEFGAKRNDDEAIADEKTRLSLDEDVHYEDIDLTNSKLTYPKVKKDDLNANDKYCIEKYDLRKIDNTFLLELIWSYWTEESLLVQACNALCLRFQNRRSSMLRDPLANLTIDPLKPLNNIIWGFIENEQHRLSLKRRAYEYENEYGLPMAGKGLGRIVPIESRTAFLSAFHHLINRCAIFYQESTDMTVKPDAYPIATALKEVQMILSEGAINQFGDLPFQARVEMMMMQWLMSRKEVKEFVGGRKSIPYPEEWMRTVDVIKGMQGWSNTTSAHFGDLAFCSEPIILSIRHDDWQILNEEKAKAWCNYWKQEMQQYIHAYRAATGVDLNTTESIKAKAPSFYFVQQEQELLRKQTVVQGR